MTIADASIEVDAPVADAYALWTSYEELPAFLWDVVEVRRLDDTHLLFAAEYDGGPRTEWHAEIIAEQPNQRVSWESETGLPGEGMTVLFEAAGDRRTRVLCELDVHGAPSDPPRQQVEKRVRRDLQLFKRLAEGHPFPREDVEGLLEPGEWLEGWGRPGEGSGRA